MREFEGEWTGLASSFWPDRPVGRCVTEMKRVAADPASRKGGSAVVRATSVSCPQITHAGSVTEMITLDMKKDVGTQSASINSHIVLIN
jgi:hypothetical protein